MATKIGGGIIPPVITCFDKNGKSMKAPRESSFDTYRNTCRASIPAGHTEADL
jgi:hypothetical protein